MDEQGNRFYFSDYDHRGENAIVMRFKWFSDAQAYKALRLREAPERDWRIGFLYESRKRGLLFLDVDSSHTQKYGSEDRRLQSSVRTTDIEKHEVIAREHEIEDYLYTQYLKRIGKARA